MDLVDLYTTCEIFPEQGLNSCLLHWEAESYPLHHQGTPEAYFLGYKHIHCALSQEVFAVGKKGCGFLDIFQQFSDVITAQLVPLGHCLLNCCDT